jgi:hypothetical protein
MNLSRVRRFDLGIDTVPQILAELRVAGRRIDCLPNHEAILRREIAETHLPNFEGTEIHQFIVSDVEA